jgi:hypothetical protein
LLSFGGKVKGISYLAIMLSFALGILSAWLIWPPRVVVTWETASEVDTAGFYLYRADSPSGPFILLNATPIPAQGDPLTGSSYRFEDRGVKWGQTYYYRLEELERSGGRNQYPEVAKVRAGAGWGLALACGVLAASLAWFGMTFKAR